ncbi:MAG: glycosyl hydrolase family 18 protein [Eubacteriales bacterium]
MSNIVANYVYEGNLKQLRDEDVRALTHLNIAFGTLQDDCTIKTDHLKLIARADELRAINPSLKVCLSIGSGSRTAFSDTASTPEKRAAVARSLRDIAAEYKLDGIDYDWEYPSCPSNGIAYRTEDKQNFTALCAEIRAQLDTISDRHVLFTLATGADYYYLDFTEMDKVQRYCDYIWLMTYDFRCGFHSLTGHHSNLYRATGDIFRTSAADAVRMFHDAGVPYEKMAVGCAFYSRMCVDVPDLNNGFLQYVHTNCGYGPQYGELVENYIGKNGFTEYWDDEAKAPYLFNGNKFISYDNERSIAAKCEYARRMGLAGVFAWDYGSDPTHTLLEAMKNGMSK